jgi:hypothetical protein
VKAWVLLLVGCFSLLGQGERCRIDSRFRSPESALATYWEALQEYDADGIAECLASDLDPVPFPGMLWFFPETRACRIDSLKIVPLEDDQVIAAYLVRYVPVGSKRVRRLQVVTELIRIQGEWRVTRPLDDQSLVGEKRGLERVDI